MLKSLASAKAFLILLLFQAAGAIVRSATHSVLPAPLIGMAILAVGLLLDRKRPHHDLHLTANSLLSWLGLLFIPVGAGILANLDLLRRAWMPLLAGLAGSTLLTLGVTAGVMQVFHRRGGKQHSA